MYHTVALVVCLSLVTESDLHSTSLRKKFDRRIILVNTLGTGECSGSCHEFQRRTKQFTTLKKSCESVPTHNTDHHHIAVNWSCHN